MELFKHQIEGIEFLKRTPKAILADEMGLGKTRQAVIAFGESGSGTIVVCPASIKINWEREIKMVYSEASIKIIGSKDSFEDIEPQEPFRPDGLPYEKSDYWWIINYDILEKKIEVLEKLVENGWAKNLILDEAHYIKGKSIRAKTIIGGRIKKKDGKMVSFKGLAKIMDRIAALTGTLILNRPIEIFNILKALGHPLGKNELEFAKKYCELFWFCRIHDSNTGRSFITPQDKAYQYYNGKKGCRIVGRFPNYQGANNLDDLRKNLEGWILRRKKKDVLDLPEKISETIIAEMSETWKKEYETAWDNYINFVKDNPVPEKSIENILMARHLVEITKLKQVCSWSKVEKISEDIEGAVGEGQKVIVFSQYTGTILSLEKSLKEKGIEVETLTGSDDMDERQSAIDNFQNNKETKVFIANIKAGGIGINLTEASIVIFADMEWSPETHRQAEDRAHRIGQAGTVNIYYYICPDTIEEDIIDILNRKKNIADQILEGKKKRVNSKGVQEEFLKRISEKMS